MEMKIRPAVLQDAPSIAHVHVASWRATYPGIVPQSFLDSLDELQFTERWQSGSPLNLKWRSMSLKRAACSAALPLEAWYRSQSLLTTANSIPFICCRCHSDEESAVRCSGEPWRLLSVEE